MNGHVTGLQGISSVMPVFVTRFFVLFSVYLHGGHFYSTEIPIIVKI